MWMIFLTTMIVVFFVVIAATWLVNKILLGIKKDNYKYDLEINQGQNTKEKGEEVK